MNHHSTTIAPGACLPLIESAVPEPEQQPATFGLPASFPAEILTDDQLEEIATWFDSWAAHILHAVRLALQGHPESVSRHQGATPVDLQHLQLHAVVLAHLLRLHPAAEETLPTLAKRLGLPCRALYYARDTVLAYIKPAMAGIITSRRHSTSFWETLSADHPVLLLSAATQPTELTILVPFKPHVHLAHRFATVQRLAAHPAVASVREDLTPTGENAVQITLKP